MRKSRFTEEQIVTALRRAEAGTPVREVCRKLQVTEQTFHRWRRKHVGLGVSELRELNQHDLRHRRVTTWLAAGKPAQVGAGAPFAAGPERLQDPTS